MTAPMQILLVSFPIYSDGFSPVACDTCGGALYEQEVNLARVRETEGFVICPDCAMLLKMRCPELDLPAQLMDGRVQEPEINSPGAQFFVDFMNAKK